MSTREEMIAHDRTRRGDRRRARRGLARLPVDGGGLRGGRRLRRERHCDACFTGNYPLGDGGEGERQVRARGDRRRPPAPAATPRWPSGSPSSPRARGPTCRRSSTGCTAGTGSRSPALPRTSPTRGRWSVRVRPGSRPGSSSARGIADRASRDAAIADWLGERDVDLIVLAGYMELLSAEFVGRFRNRIVNVHPALLPSFPGLDAIGQALAHGVAVTGVTVHFVDEGVDSGPIVLQRAIQVPYTRDRAQLEEEIHAGRARAATRGDPPDRRRGGADRPGEPALVHVDVEAERIGMADPVTTGGGRQRSAAAEDAIQVRRALISVSDKTGIVDFARGLARAGGRDRLHRRHGGGAARGGRGGARRRRRSRVPGDPRRAGEDASSAAARGAARGARRPRAHGDPRGRGDRADRPGLREPLPVRAHRGRGWT